MSLATLASGAVFFAERLSAAQGVLCLLLVGAAVVAAFGEHATHELQPTSRRAPFSPLPPAPASAWLR